MSTQIIHCFKLNIQGSTLKFLSTKVNKIPKYNKSRYYSYSQIKPNVNMGYLSVFDKTFGKNFNNTKYLSFQKNNSIKRYCSTKVATKNKEKSDENLIIATLLLILILFGFSLEYIRLTQAIGEIETIHVAHENEIYHYRRRL